MVIGFGGYMELSVTNRRWSLLPTDMIKVRGLMNEFALSPIIATCLAPMVEERPPRAWLQPSFANLSSSS